MNRVTRKPDIARAIRRSRQSRAALRARRRRSVAALGLLTVALAGAGTWSVGALTGHDILAAAVAKAESVADLLSQRSPGERTTAQLTKTKHAKALAKLHPAVKPRAIKHIPAAPKIAMVDIDKLLEPPLPLQVFAEAPPPLLGFTPPPSLGTFVGPPPSAGTPGGTGPGGFPGSPPKDIVPVPSAVPEPGTWATMLLGFALIGWRVHARRDGQPKFREA